MTTITLPYSSPLIERRLERQERREIRTRSPASPLGSHEEVRVRDCITNSLAAS